MSGFVALGLVAGACGSDAEEAATSAASSAAAAVTTAAAAGATTAAPAATTAAAAATAPGEGSKSLGPLKVGVINSDELFGEYSSAIKAAAAYVNKELKGLDGREIQVSVCTIAYGNPDDTQRCANEIAAAKPDFAISTLNQFGSHFAILRGAGIPVLVGTPVAIPDYTTEGVVGITGGGGCPGTLTAMAQYAAVDLKAKRIAVPYYNIPSGALCNSDNEEKPFEILKGNVPGAKSPLSGTIKDLEYTNIPLAPGGDATPVASKIMEYKPDAIIFSGPATDCWPLVTALGSVGWTPDKIPLLFTGSCFDDKGIAGVGALAKGMYFVGASAHITTDPAKLTNAAQKLEAETYQKKVVEYGLKPELMTRGFAQTGFTLVMSMYQRAQEVAKAGKKVDGKTLLDAFKATKDSPQFGSTPISCSTAKAPYITLCNELVSITQWDGTVQKTIKDNYNGLTLIEGTEIRKPKT